MLGLVGEQGSEQECYQPLQGWNPVNKNLFSSVLIVRSCIKATTCGRAQVCSVTWLPSVAAETV